MTEFEDMVRPCLTLLRFAGGPALSLPMRARLQVRMVYGQNSKKAEVMRGARGEGERVEAVTRVLCCAVLYRQILKLMKGLDTNHDGRVNLREFRGLFRAPRRQ
jgi:hypothetical protein